MTRRKARRGAGPGERLETNQAGEPETDQAGELETDQGGELEADQAGEPETDQVSEPETDQAGEPETGQAGELEGSGPLPSTSRRLRAARAEPSEERAPASDESSAERGAQGDPGDATKQSDHLRGLLEALVFATDKPIATGELAKAASAPVKDVKKLMGELKQHYAQRGIVLQELAGGWLFRTSAAFAPFVRELTSERPVKLTRAQIETLAITAYRQPITRPEIDEIRGVDSGATLKLLLERELLRILGKKDEPGRPLLYGTTSHFLEFFGLKSLRDLPTLREFTELSQNPEDGGEAPNVAAAGPIDTLKAPPRPLYDDDFEPLASPPAAPADDPPARDTMIPSAPPTGDLDDPPDADSAPAGDE